jgi:hypothetical protein
VGIATAVLGLPGILVDPLLGGMVSIVGFIGMITTEIRALSLKQKYDDIDHVVAMIEERADAMDEEIRRRYWAVRRLTGGRSP